MGHSLRGSGPRRPAFLGPGPLARGGLPLKLRFATFARSLPVPLDAISSSLHRPLRGTPHIAWGPRCRVKRTQEWRGTLLEVVGSMVGGASPASLDAFSRRYAIIDA